MIINPAVAGFFVIAKKEFEKLSPSRQKEILRYIIFLKSEESVDKNIHRAIAHLTNSKPFIGREK
jgi:uncharacterized protein YdeI (YjbR/CyaY-like superfamily)